MKIIVIKGDKPIDQISFTGDTAIIGRKSGCDVSIKDPAVSGNHAKLQKVGNNYMIHDLESTNGTHMDGKRVKQQVLKNEDIVTIGRHKLKFLMGETAAPSTPLEKVEIVNARLTILSGDQQGEKIPLGESLTTVGEPGVQVAAVSRRPQGHFIIHVDGGKDKKRVPLVNGQPTGFKSKKLENGDRIEIAGVEMQYESD